MLFGVSVAMNGETVVIGAPASKNDNGVASGSAYVFIHSGNTWTQKDKITATDGAAGDSFGECVAISGTTVVIGAPGDSNQNGDYAGSAFVFELE